MRLKDSLSADDLDCIALKIESRLNSFEAWDLLNMSAEMLQLLRDEDILVPKTDALDKIPKYGKSDIEQLLRRIYTACYETKRTLQRNGFNR